MDFEFDDNKSQSNKIKHGINFLEAQKLWQDVDFLEIPAKTIVDESRFIIIGRIGAKHWSAVVTYRGQKIRIISVRRARKSEVTLYES
ncbi:MAG: BrnT family toxin [Xenococcus sp. (in: cyanobacteria)]